MKIVQTRYFFGDDFTLSRLFIDGVPFVGCPYILEDKVREVAGVPVEEWKVPRETAIPVGVYEVATDMSTRFKKLMPRLLLVKGFEGVRVHAGNTSHDTEGCLLGGKERDEKHGEVSGSRVAIAALTTRIDAALARKELVQWRVEGLPPTARHSTAKIDKKIK